MISECCGKSRCTVKKGRWVIGRKVISATRFEERIFRECIRHPEAVTVNECESEIENFFIFLFFRFFFFGFRRKGIDVVHDTIPG